MTQTATKTQPQMRTFSIERFSGEQYALQAAPEVEPIATAGMVSDFTGYVYFKGSHFPLVSVSKKSYQVMDYKQDECRVVCVTTDATTSFFVLGSKKDEALRLAESINTGVVPHPLNDLDQLLVRWKIAIPEDVRISWVGQIPLGYTKLTASRTSRGKLLRFFPEGYSPTSDADKRIGFERLQASMRGLINLR